MSLDGRPSADDCGDVPERSDEDLPDGDNLLGVPIEHFMQIRALRGVVLLVTGVAILVWPGRTGRALGMLIGVALLAYAVTLALELRRNRSRRHFGPVVSIGVSAGLAVALLVDPDASLLTVAQVSAVIMLGIAAVTLMLVLVGRHAVSWGLAKAFALAVTGGLLLEFPGTLVAAVTSVVAGGLAAVALIDVFTAPSEHVDDSQKEIVARGPGAGGMSEMTSSVASWIRRRPSVAEDRGGLMDKIYFEGEYAPVRFARYVTLMVLAASIAALGVVAESTAVVIGAMLVAPLMTPLMGTAFAVTMGWMRRLRRSALLSLLGMGLAIGVGAVVGAVMPRGVDITTNTQILARIAPTTVDLAIAIAAGAAGAFALSRRDVSDSLPGVAVAISLVPPLTVVGLCWQEAAWSAGNGALLLFLTNAVAILVAGGVTFILVGAAPLQQVARGQERWATVIAATVSMAGIILLLLLLNGSRAASAEVELSRIDRVMDEWIDVNEDYERLETRTLADGEIIIDLAGPGTPPDLEALLEQLEAQVSPDTDVALTWIQQNRASIRRG